MMGKTGITTEIPTYERFDKKCDPTNLILMPIYEDDKRTKATGMYVTKKYKYFIYEGDIILRLSK